MTVVIEVECTTGGWRGGTTNTAEATSPAGAILAARTLWDEGAGPWGSKSCPRRLVFRVDGEIVRAMETRP